MTDDLTGKTPVTRTLPDRPLGQDGEQIRRTGTFMRDAVAAAMPKAIEATRRAVDGMTAGFATGGYVSTPGLAGPDTVPAILSRGRCCLVLNGGSVRHRELLDLINASGKDVDVVVVDGTEHRTADITVEWKPPPDPRVRADHAAFAFASTWWDDVPEPPAYHLGRFNCRGDYVWPGMPEREQPLTLMRQSGGQIAEVLDAMTRRVSEATRVTPAMLLESVPAEAFHRETARRGAILSKRIDDALLATAYGVEGSVRSRLMRDVKAYNGPALTASPYHRRLAVAFCRQTEIAARLTMSRRAFRRWRGKARALRRWQ
jgi:hypothetical protein